jgi:hypothetical protein
MRRSRSLQKDLFTPALASLRKIARQALHEALSLRSRPPVSPLRVSPVRLSQQSLCTPLDWAFLSYLSRAAISANLRRFSGRSPFSFRRLSSNSTPSLSADRGDGQNRHEKHFALSAGRSSCSYLPRTAWQCDFWPVVLRYRFELPGMVLCH